MEINKNILEKEEIHGIWRIIPSISMSEIISQSGFDFQILDCEHGGYDFNTLYADICACELNNSTPFVRVSGLNKVEVQRCLDLGAKGIVFPQINTFQDFKDASDLLMYSPVGTRGFNPFVRSNKFGINKNQLKACIDHVIACCVAAGKKVSLMVHTTNQYEFYKNKGVAGFVHAVESFKIKSYFNDSLNSFKR
jgi:4-hydroxy-2-oxoheptanedioate aldolase